MKRDFKIALAVFIAYALLVAGYEYANAATVTNTNFANLSVDVPGGTLAVNSAGQVTTTRADSLRGLYALGFVDTSAFPFYASAPSGTANTTTFLRGDFTYSTTLSGPLTAGGVILPAAGNGIAIKTGTNATMGRAVCNGVTEVTVATTKVTTNSDIFLTENVPGGTPLGVTYVSSRSAGTSFGFKCAATDTSTVAWLLIEPAP